MLSMERSNTTRRGVLAGAAGALVALAGCRGGDGTPTETATGPGEVPLMPPGMGVTDDADDPFSGGDAMLRVAHLAPDVPSVDVTVDDTTVLADAPFGTVGAYLSLPTGEHRVTVTPTGGSTAVADQPLTLASGPQTAAAIGDVAGADQTVRLLPDDDMTAEAGSTHVRAVHVIPDGPAVDVSAGAALVADGVEFGEAGEYVTVSADVAAVELRPDTRSNDAEPVATFGVDLRETAAQTVFAAGYLEPAGDQSGVRLVPATDAEPDGPTPAGPTMTAPSGL